MINNIVRIRVGPHIVVNGITIDARESVWPGAGRVVSLALFRKRLDILDRNILKRSHNLERPFQFRALLEMIRLLFQYSTYTPGMMNSEDIVHRSDLDLGLSVPVSEVYLL